MTDLEERIKAAVTASIRDVEPPPDLLAAVHWRHRRGRRWRAAIGAAAVMALLAGAIALVARPSRPTPPAHPHHAHAAVFPGGGRLLLDSADQLRWLWSDGRVRWIRGHFDQAVVSAGELLAWQYTGPRAGYYTMTLNGQRQRRVLPMAWSRRVTVIQAQLSLDRRLLGYVRQDIVSASSVIDTLWIKNLATGRSVSAGQIASTGFAWIGAGTLVATVPGGHSLVSVDAATGARSRFLAVTDPALVRAYERVRPGAGPPALIRADGVPGTGWTDLLAIWLAAAGHSPGAVFPQDGSFADPAEIILAGRRVDATYAPSSPYPELGLTWGSHGLFVVQTGAGDKPGSWRTYAGYLGVIDRGRRQKAWPLSAGVPFGQDGAVISASGTALALDDNGTETLVPVPRTVCRRSGGARCPDFQRTVLSSAGVVQAWLP